MTTLVADASVAVKWFLPPSPAEEDSDQAATLLEAFKSERITLRQPPHWLAEVAGVLSRLSPSTAEDDIALLYGMHIPILDSLELYPMACALALASKQHVFDTLYHAVSLLTPDATLVTADEQYYRQSKHFGAISLLARTDLSR